MKNSIEKENNNNYHYFIPCYDIINNEIYFSEFFTEEIISKPNNLKQKQKDFFIEQLKTKLEPNKTNTNNNNNNMTNKKDKKKEKEIKQLKFFIKNEKKCLDLFKFTWKKIQILSGFNTEHFISKTFEEYFKRPFFSRFLISENLQLYSYNSCNPLPNVIASYLTISVNFDFHLDSLFNTQFDKENFNSKTEKKYDSYNIIKYEFDIIKNQFQKISLFYPIDTLIKDTINILFKNIDFLINKYSNSLQNFKDVSFNSDNVNDDLINKQEICRLLNIFKENLNKHLKSKSDKFILKVAESEEYLYGDYILGQYDFVRYKVRQYESITLILKVIPFYIVQPPLFGFPPILITNDTNYENLFDLYVKLYPNHEIIYRLFKPDEKSLNKYLKKNYNNYNNFRQNRLNKYTESSDCDFPFCFTIVNLKNVFKFKNWFDNELYNKNELVLPYINPIKKYYIKNNNNVFSLIKNCFYSKKENDIEKEILNKLILKHENKKKQNKIIQKRLNNLKIKSNYEYEKYNFLNLVQNTSYLEIINKLLENYSQIHNKQKESNENFSIIEQDEKEEENIFNYNTNFNNNNTEIFSEREFEIDTTSKKNSKKKKINKKILLSDNHLMSFKYKPFHLKNHPSTLPSPIYLRIKLSLIYGCYTLRKFMTEPFLITDDIIVNEKIILDSENCLISHIPMETRLAISAKVFNQKLEKSFTLGSCQIPIYNEFGEMQQGEITFNFWPNIKIFDRVNVSTSFMRIFPKNSNEIDLNFEHENFDKELIKFKDKINQDFLEMLKIEFDEKKRIEEEEKIFGNENENKIKENSFNTNNNIIIEEDEEDDISNNSKSIIININKKKSIKKENFDNESIKKTNSLILNKINSLKNNNNNNIIKKIDNKNKNNYPSITIKFPKFSSPLIHNTKNTNSYRKYLEIKHNKIPNNDENDFIEIRKLFGNSQISLKNISKSLNNPEKISYFPKEKSPENNYPTDIWQYLKKTLPSIIKILKKDPLEKLEKKEIIAILICRDYITNISSALELFLRSIDWLNPFEVDIAHKYLSKWVPIDCEDAVSLLDARFPDTKVREYAIQRLRNFPDEMISAFMLMLCQSLIYETFLINPLSDFLIERSLLNPKLIGNSFLWNSRINKKNPIFAERLSAYLLQLLMVSGNKFINDSFESVKMNYYLELITYGSKNAYKNSKKDQKKSNAIKFVKKCCKNFNEKFPNNIKFPIDPTYLSQGFTNNVLVFNSKMVPILLEFYTRESNYKKKVIFKIGDDLRQDVLTIQMLKIMDKLWLDNNLDLKLITYKVFPTEINAGYIECVDAKELSQIQNQGGVGGALDKESIIKYFIENNLSDNFNQINNKTDNFIKSLAGYCVATCVLGVADRHSSNVMIKKNGIFLHIDFGHILGNFKVKFGVKRERSLFLLTPEMANVYINEKKEKMFEKICAKAFNILRHNAPKLINNFIIMSSSGMPEFFGLCDIEYMKNMLVLEKPNDEDAENYFIETIKKCKNEKFRIIDNIIHNFKQ